MCFYVAKIMKERLSSGSGEGFHEVKDQNEDDDDCIGPPLPPSHKVDTSVADTTL